MKRSVQWIGPQPGWVNHDGSPVAAADRFPTQPPAEIGPISSASTWFGGSGPKDGNRVGAKIALAICMFLLSALIPGMAALAFTKSLAVAAGVAGGVGVVATVIVLVIVNSKQPACTFVGSDGIAVFKGRGSSVSGRVLKFSDIGDVEVRDVDVTIGGATVGKRYEFTFADGRGRPALKFAGLHGPKAPPAPHDYTAFGMAAQRAWQHGRAAQPGF